MQQRPSSRLLILNNESRLLLFKFEFKNGPLAHQVFWATPGGAVDAGESFEDAALRELYEEVGIVLDHPGPQIAQRLAKFALPTGERVEADERYFLLRADSDAVSDTNWTEVERKVMTTHRWWGQTELQSATEQIWPENLPEMLIAAGAWVLPVD